jgi:amino acid adenylation domain-containing protein
MSVIEERFATLSPEVQQQLRRKLQQKKTEAAIPRRSGTGDRFPLSFAQQRLWFLDRLQPGSTAYNVVEGHRIGGEGQPPLDLQLLQRCFDAVVTRHEILRTVFRVENGEPVQVVLPALGVPLQYVDARGAAGDPAQEWADIEASTPFDLERGPLVRVRVVRLDDLRYGLLIAMHHIVCDGWSSRIFIEEMAALYEAFATGREPALPALPIQYADYAAWQRQQLSGDALDAQLRFWREHLADAEPLELPGDRPRPLEPTGGGGTVQFTFPSELSEALVALSRREGVTMFMLFLAAYYVLLSRLTGSKTVLAGTVMAGRQRQETERLIGFFVNTVVLRGDLSGDPSFRELLARVRETSLAAHAHQEFPFERIVEELRPDRTTPLLQAMFVVQSSMKTDEGNTGFALEPVHATRRTSRFDLSLGLEEKESWCGSLEYATDLFDEETARRLVAHLEQLLASAVANPEAKVSELELLTADERQEMLVTWNDTARPIPDARVDELFAEQVRLRPEAMALSSYGTTLTYAELSARANAFADELRAHDAGPERVVALLLPQSIELIIAELGVLIAGGAYLPIDPAYPQGRIDFMLEDAQPVAIVRQGLVIEPTGRVADPAERSANDLAYIIYTSGSTGKPKGVLIQHPSLTNLTIAFRESMQITADSRVLLFASPGFDASVEEVWTALTSGACICIASRDVLLPVDPLVETIARERATSALMPPSVLALLDPQQLPTMRSIASAGEACNAALAAKWRPFVHFVNGYGPTETTVIATTDPDTDGTTIGRPIPNTTCYILDAERNPVPAGVAGELYIGGAGVARGYLARPELTAQKFIANPFGEGRLYRTGDRVRFRRDGRIDYLGRFDDQVKLRGFRIELGEIEAALRDDERVAEAVVIVRDNRLLAYVSGDAPDTAQLRAALEQRMPKHMMPSAIVVLDAFPMTPNKKIDRKALPDPERMQESPIGEPLRGAAEELLGSIWCELLGLERAGADDDFFESGGHSLLATRLVSRIEECFGVRIALRNVFDHTTLRALAAAIEEERRGGETVREPIVARGMTAAPLSFGQQRLWVLEQLGAGGAVYNIPLQLRIKGALDVDALDRAVRTLVERHEVLRSAIAMVDSELRQTVMPLGDWSLTQGRTSDIDASIREEASTPFDLAHPPLLRAKVLEIAQDDHLFLLTVHHIAADGWSIGLLTDELLALYRGESPAPLDVQYSDYAAWQRGRGDELARQLDYWRNEIGGVEPVELPLDFARPATPSCRGGMAQAHLAPAAAKQLRMLAQKEGCTLYMALLAAYEVLLSRVTGAEEVLVGSPIAGRTRAEVEPLIGFFVNTLVLRGDLRGDPTLRDLLARVRTSALDAFANQDVPFEKLVEELRPERALSQNPLFETMFVLQNATAPRELNLPGLTISTPDGDGQAPAKFALTLTASETTDNGIALLLEYQRDLFAPDTAERLLAMFTRIVEAMTSAPEQRVSEVELLDDESRLLIVHTWNATDAPIDERTVDELVCEQARLRPDAPALSFDGETLTYRELVDRATVRATELRANGARPETLVPVMLERSIELVVTQLAVLMTGAAYLPIDPSYPQDRIDFMLEDSARFQADAGARSRLAYVIYTSGSTGKPKGVMVEHRSLTNLARTFAAVTRTDSTSRVLQFASASFDASVEEVFTTLTSGACLVLARREDLLPVQPLTDLIVRERVSVITLPPSVLGMLDPRDTPTLRTVVSAGEACNANVAAKWKPLLVNGYGPTEATVCATSDADTDGTSIGRPLPNVKCYILDRHRRPVPVGVPGELWIGGVGVARGYLERPELTAERFIENPFAEGRIYRTGDRARFQADGRIRFEGRLDAQVKLRGYRIEPGEIEALLREQEGVVEALAVVRDEQLYAYVTGTPAGNPREALQAKLPAFMVPAAVMTLAAFPLTPNGKIDRKALPLPSQAARERVAPRNAVEAALVAIFEELLACPCGVTDDFFGSGGHSLLAVTLIERVRKTLGRSVPLRALFEGATIERIAEMLGAAEESNDGELARLNDREGDTTLVLVHAIGGDVFSYRQLASHIDMPVVALRATAATNALTLEQLAARYAGLLTGKVILAGWSFGGVVAQEMARQMDPEGLILIDSWINVEAPDTSMQMFLRDLAASHGYALPEHVATIDACVAVAGEADIPLEATVLERQYEVFRANGRRMAEHIPQPYGGRATLVTTDDRPRGWTGLVFDLETVRLEGDHYSLLTDHVAAVARVIESNIQQKNEVLLAADIA